MTGLAGNINFMEIITFYTQAKGSSHISSGKPCQDSGDSYQKDGIYIAIVCDGHGGESYVRSDRGSKLATEIAKEKILSFIAEIPPDVFSGKKGSVTSMPTQNPLIDKDRNQVDISSLSESQIELIRQNHAYIHESTKNQEIENLFRTLFSGIWESWKFAINVDAQESKFSKKEKEKLGSQRIEKAYGTTLMAAVRTPDYWFAFHIGDGKLLACNRLMEWFEPVPWDCNCFLNITTSLCDRSPVEEFRYAFDGTGDFPLAFTLGSDGIDDTFIKTELIHKFYSQLLCVFNDRNKEEAEELLKKHLSELSKRGSHDDMSVAAIIEKDYLPKAIEHYGIISEVRQLNNEKRQRQESITSSKEAYDKCLKEIAKLSQERDDFAISIWNFWLEALKKKKLNTEQYHEKDKLVQKAKAQSDEIRKQTQILIDEFNEWLAASKTRVEELKQIRDVIKDEVYPQRTETPNDDSMSEIEPNNESDLDLQKSMHAELDNDCSDNPEVIYEKSINAQPTEEELAKIDKESAAQANEILNNKI